MITRTVSWEYPGYYGFLLCAQGTFCFKPMGIILVKSTQIRWFSRWSGGGGWSGRAEAQRRPRVSKLRAKGLSTYHSSETVVEAARREATGPSYIAILTREPTQGKPPGSSPLSSDGSRGGQAGGGSGRAVAQRWQKTLKERAGNSPRQPGDLTKLWQKAAR